MNEVVLVSMPFGPVMSPSIALGLLKAVLARRGFRARTRYFTIPFAERLGEEAYTGIADGIRPGLPKMTAEWIFNGALFDVSDQDAEEYVRSILLPPPHSKDDVAQMVADVRRARGLVDSFLEECASIILADEPRIVGFTSIFQQHVASLALSKRLKRIRPDLFVIIGGANCEGIMGAETIRQFPFVDATLSGEGELVFPEFVARVLDGRSPDGLAGVRTQTTIDAEFLAGRFTSAPMVDDLNELPYPDYEEYFTQFAASRFGDEWQPSIFYETSRGCWWGERMHCTFCGLNGSTMKYRSKEAARAIDELVELTQMHPGCDVEVTDNILDLGYFDTFLPDLAARKLGVSLFYETKANLRREQVRMLRDAGVLVIQPGIESLSDSVLKLMRKGVSALQNIQLLKWAKEMGIEARWNILCGFPGEDPEEYVRMTELLPLLSHLNPPAVCTVIRLDRFSPNFFDSDRLGFRNVEPLPAYKAIYPFSLEFVTNLAYFFEFDYQRPQDTGSYLPPLRDRVRQWQKVHSSSALLSIECGENIIIWDLRPIATRHLWILSGLDAHFFRACGTLTDLRQLMANLPESSPLSAADLEARLQPLVDAGILLKQGNRYLGLPIAVGEYQPTTGVEQRLRELIAQSGRESARGFIVPADIAPPGPRCGNEINTDSPAWLGRTNFLATARFSIEEGHLLIAEGKE